ncbi:MAG: recombination protein NinB [Methylobacter sp.]
MTQIVINTRQDKFNLIEAIKDIRAEPKMMVTIEEYKDDRSAAQNRLYWAWLTDCQNTGINEQARKTKDEWHLFFKEKSLLNIFLKDPKKKYAGLLGGFVPDKDRFWG